LEKSSDQDPAGGAASAEVAGPTIDINNASTSAIAASPAIGLIALLNSSTLLFYRFFKESSGT
jgi:hypothetical protein